MPIQLTKIDDKADGFSVEFTVSNVYKRTFDPRPESKDQMIYARECVQGITKSPVENAAGVYVVPKPQQPAIFGANDVVDLNPPLGWGGKPEEPPPEKPPLEPPPAEPPAEPQPADEKPPEG